MARCDLSRSATACAILLAAFALGSPARAQPALRERILAELADPSRADLDSWLLLEGRRAGPRLADLIERGSLSGAQLEDALFSLALSGHPRAAPVLGRVLRDPDSRDTPEGRAAQRSALRGLAMLDTAESRTLLASALNLPHTRDLSQKIIKYCAYLRAKECCPALKEYRGDVWQPGDMESTTAMCFCCGDEAVARMTRKLTPESTLYTYRTVLLGWIANRKATDVLVDWALHRPRKLRMGADVDVAWALGRAEHPQAVTVLRKYMAGENRCELFFAALSLAEHGDRASLPLVQKASKLKVRGDVALGEQVMQRCVEWTWDRYDFARRQLFRREEYALAMAYARLRLGEKSAREALEQGSKSADRLTALYADTLLLRAGDKAAAGRIERCVAEMLRLGLQADRIQIEERMRQENVLDALRTLVRFAPRSAARVIVRLAASSYSTAQRYAHLFFKAVPTRELARAWADALGRGSFRQRMRAAAELRLIGEPALGEIARASKRLDTDGRVLAATLLGEFDSQAGRAQLEQLAKRDPAWQVQRAARRALALRAGRPWPPRPPIASSDEGLVRYGQAEGLRGRLVALAELKDKVYAAGDQGLFACDGYGFERVGSKGLCPGAPGALGVLGGRLLVFGPGGLSEGDGESFTCRPWPHPAVRQVLADGEGLLLGTDRGLLSFDGRRARALPGASARRVEALARRGKTLWVAYTESAGLDGLRAKPASASGGLRRSFAPVVYQQRGKRWLAVREPLLAYSGWRLPMAVHSLAAGPDGELLAGCTEGVLRFDGRSWRLLDDRDGFDARMPVTALQAADRSALAVLHGPYLDRRDGRGRWRRSQVRPAEGEEATARAGSLRRGNGDLWFALGSADSGLVRIAGQGRELRALPPETLVASASAGAWSWQNPLARVRPPNRARSAGTDRPIEVPAAQIAIEAAAQDPWDYEAVEFQFKLDERPWTAWQKKNGLLTPLLGEGRHLLRVRSRDASGHEDPTPAELHFSVHTRQLAVIRILDGRFKEVFPSQYRRYEREGLGRIQVENRATEPVDVKVNLKVQELFEAPASRRLNLPPGAKRWLQLSAPFDARVLAMTGGGQSQAIVEAEFEFEGISRQVRRSFPLRIEPANAFDWSEPARLAGFINSADPLVARFGAAVFREHAKLPGARLPPVRNLTLAALLFRALQAHGLRYKPDPASPFAGIRPGSQGIDTVRFPGQTLVDKTGDCDDLVVLCASLLEQVEVATAVVPVAGHVFLLLDSGVLAANREAFAVPDSMLVARGGRLWIPLESTWLGRKGATFRQAWSAGAEAHARHRPAPEAVFEVRAAWADTPPATLPAPREPLPLPAGVCAAGKAEVGELVEGYRKAVLARCPKGEGRDGLLARGRYLAKNGLYTEAEQALSRAAAAGAGFAAEHALGVVFAGKGEMDRAASAFGRALERASSDAQRFQAAMALAAAHRAAGRLDQARAECEKALSYNPAASFDSRYIALLRFLQAAEKTKAAGSLAIPPPVYQLLLSEL
ncbi:MAG: tetratricopeptide repeat protein [Deltaproteobacteria bacterium]|nr:tetratricopeptide repeat protein [Deltaproteobacteria bacterium]